MVVFWASLILANLLVFPDLNFTVVNDKYHLCFMCEGTAIQRICLSCLTLNSE